MLPVLRGETKTLPLIFLSTFEDGLVNDGLAFFHVFSLLSECTEFRRSSICL